MLSDQLTSYAKIIRYFPLIQLQIILTSLRVCNVRTYTYQIVISKRSYTQVLKYVGNIRNDIIS